MTELDTHKEKTVSKVRRETMEEPVFATPCTWVCGLPYEKVGTLISQPCLLMAKAEPMLVAL